MMSEWLASVAPAVGDHLWQSTAFAVAAALVTLLLKKNHARVRYWIWLAALMKFLVPFSLLIALGGLLPTPQHASVATPATYAAMDTVSQPFAAEVFLANPIQPTRSKQNRMPEVIASLWLCGVVVVLAMWGIRWCRVATMARKATRPDSGRELDALRRLEQKAGMRPVQLLLTQSPMEPGMFGVFRPVLLWPAGISARLSDQQMEAILAHELCHVRRRDNSFAVAQMVVETVFWFYPLVWWMGAQMVKERERACDEEVLTQSRNAEVYAESILKICEFCLESPLACVSGITGADLKQRIVQIMSRHLGKQLSLGKKAILAAACLAAIAAPVAFGVVQMLPLYVQILHATGPLPSYEVATIKPDQDGRPAASLAKNIRRFNGTTKELIEGAYNIPYGAGERVIGGPGWITSEHYVIVGEIPDDLMDKMQTMSGFENRLQNSLMKQSLLAERFRLKVHFETRELPVYALVVAKGGPKMKTADPNAPPIPKAGYYMNTLGPHSGLSATRDANGALEMTAKGVAMSAVAESLEEVVDDLGSRTVVDRTGLTGQYDFTLKWSPQQSANVPVADSAAESDAPSIFTALQEQLGLKLVPAKAPVEVVVIDSIEKPTVDGAEVARPAALSPGRDNGGASNKYGDSGATLQNDELHPPKQSLDGAPGRAQSRPQNAAAPSRLYEYEAATIKPSKGPGPDHKIGLWTAPDGFNAWFVTPQQMVSMAYGVQSFRISGGPSWLPSERFDMEAKMDAATADALAKLSPDQRALAQQQMLQALLADRFQLTVHRETKELTTYTLVLAKGGPKLQEARPGDTYPNGGTYPDGTHAGAGDMQGSQLNGDLRGQAVPIARLVQSLTQMLGRPVSDKTELKGVYDFKLRYTPDDRLQPPPGAPPNLRLPQPPADSNAPSLFEALQQQLGLKLESGKEPVEVIVIDHIVRPSQN